VETMRSSTSSYLLPVVTLTGFPAKVLPEKSAKNIV
jgi:hypothetical protein